MSAQTKIHILPQMHCLVSGSGYCAPVGSGVPLLGDATLFRFKPRPDRFNAEHLLLKRVNGFALLLKFIIAWYNKRFFWPLLLKAFRDYF